MLSLFPSLLTYELLGPFLLRLTLGVTFAYFGYKRIKSQKENSNTRITVYGAVEIALAVLMIIGLYTQLAALVMALILVIKLVYKIKKRAFLTDGVNYYLLLLVMALSILVTGAGAFAFDMPL